MCKKSNKTFYILHFYYNLFIMYLSILDFGVKDERIRND